MKKFKVYALLFTMVLFVGLSVSKIKAAESYTADEQLAIDKLATTEVMIGTGNGFEGSSNLTRAQAAAIMVRLKGISEDDVEKERKAQNTIFKDVKKDHWALGYINIAYKNELVKGVSDTEFNPEAKVKISELVTMAVRSLNAGKMVDGYAEAWPENYMNFAKEEKLLTKIKRGKDADATRMETALLVADTLEADMWKVQSVITSKDGNKNTYAKDKGNTLLKTMFNIDVYNDQTVDTVSKSKKTASFKSSKVPTTECGDKVELSNISSKDNALVWYNTKLKKIVLIKKVEKGSYIKGKAIDFASMKSFTESSGKITFNVDGKSSTYYISETSDSTNIAEYNGKKITKKELVTLLLKSSTNLKEITGSIEVTGTNIDFMYIGDYNKVGVASSVSSTKVNFYDDDDVVGTTAPSKITISNDTCAVVNIDGDNLDIDAIKKGFVVKYFYDETNKKYHIMTYSKTIDGEVKSRSTTEIKVGSKTYKVNFIGTYTRPDTGEDIKLYLNDSDEVILYSQDEDIIDYEEDDEDDSSSDEYGVITQAQYSSKKLYVSINGGTKKEVNVEDTLDMFEDDFDDEEELREYIIEECVGTFAQYKVENSKYVLYEFGDCCSDDVESMIVTPSRTQKLDKTNETIGGYDYDNPTIYEVVVTENSSNNYSCTKKTIKLSSLSSKNYQVSLVIDEDDEVIAMTIIKYEEDTPVTPSTPTTPVTPANKETEGIIQSVTEVTASNRLDIKVITNGGLATFKCYDKDLKDSLKVGSYVKYKLDGDVITEFTLNKTVEEINLVKCKIIEKGAFLTVRKPDGTEGSNPDPKSYSKFFYLKATGITETEGKVTSVTGLSYTTTEPTKLDNKSTFEATTGTVCYLYMIDDNVVAVLYK